MPFYAVIAEVSIVTGAAGAVLMLIGEITGFTPKLMEKLEHRARQKGRPS